MDTWSVDVEDLGHGPARLRVRDHCHGGRFLSRAEVHDLWRSNGPFCEAFSQMLAAVPMAAYFWETPASTADSFDAPFECVVTPSPALARKVADPETFAAQFAGQAAAEVVSFGNLGGDADLVAPRPIAPNADYAHLASFLRTAPASQAQAIWPLIADTTERWLARGQPGWISTSGLGVSWLHIRIDSRPKYYSYAPYKKIDHG